MKRLWALFGILIIGFGLICIETMQFGLAQTGTNVNGIIFSDTIWTKTDSPIILTGPTAINVGVTVTIEPGVMVNINGYYIQVNGTLTAKGTDSERIQINNGLLRFTPVSIGWNDENDTGCIIQYASLYNASISASNAIKLDYCTVLGGKVIVGDTSTITTNNISSDITTGKQSTVLANQINGSITAGAMSTFFNNKIQGGVLSDDATKIINNTIGSSVVCNGNTSLITNNIINGRVTGGVISNNTISTNGGNINVQGAIVNNNIIKGGTVSASAQIINNVIVSGNYTTEFRVFGGYSTVTENTPAIIGTVTGEPIISGNTITGGGWYRSLFIWYESITIVPAIDLSSGKASTISNNTIIGKSGLAINGSCKSILNNTITGDVNSSATLVHNNTVYGSFNLNSDTITISNNTVSKTISVNSLRWNVTGNIVQGITENQGNGYILDNYIIGNQDNRAEKDNDVVNTSDIGIYIINEATVERNFIANKTVGIVIVNGTALIINNTIINNGIGILLHSPSATTAINYNNIQFNNQNIVLDAGTINNIDAINNWWGTNIIIEIEQTFYDYKNDFNLGNVTYIPFLFTDNPEAKPNATTQILAFTPNSPTTTPTSTITPTPTPISEHTTTPITLPTSTPNHTPISTAASTKLPLATQTPVITLSPEITTTIPEIPTGIILTVLTLSTIVAVTIVQKKHKQTITIFS